jgi:2-polyprenyl-3-methyl-5-hydroxy-6-metoxy-1,4-benzoquinol methylase
VTNGLYRGVAMSASDGLHGLLAEQIAYYRARAPEYFDGVIEGAVGGGELEAALDAFRPAGHVLELACGPGTWTPRLLRHAASVTALDASPEMIALASTRVGAHAARVRFVCADVFGWTPDRRYDVVFFGFWLSHVPLERFESFWSLVDAALAPGGRVFFADDAYRTPDELIEGESSSTIQRRLNDGTRHRAVKVPHDPADLERRLARLGWRIAVTQTSGPFFWGAGSR